jgi:hypothetical protein
MRWASFSKNSNLRSELTRLQRTQFGECERGGMPERRWWWEIDGRQVSCRGGWAVRGWRPMAVGTDDLDGDTILTVGIPGDNVLGVLLSLGNDHLHFAPAIHDRTAPAMTMEAMTWGHRHLKWGGRAGSAASCGQPRHSDQTAQRQRSGGWSLT